MTTQQFRIALKSAWDKACAAEGIPTDSKFVVFGKTEEAAQYNTLALQFFGAGKEKRAPIHPHARHENRVRPVRSAEVH